MSVLEGPMIVECGSCATRFQLDDSRIPDSGIRVRCSKCKQSFFLPHPDAGAQEPRIEEATPGSPDETRDLRADSLESAAALSMADAPAPEASEEPSAASDDGGAAAGGLSADDEEEADWGFNDDAPSDDFEDTDAGLSSSLLANDSGSDLHLADENESTGSQFEPLGESIGLSDDVEPELDSAADAVGALAGGDDNPLLGEDGAEAATTDAPASDDSFAPDLGSPEEWDFLSDDPVAAPAASSPPARGAAIGRVDVGPPSELPEPVPSPAIGASTPVRRELHSTVNAIGWVLCVTLFAAGIARGLLPVHIFSTPADAPVEFVSLGNLEAEGSDGRWVDTAGHGRVFVVSGELRNPTRSVSTADASLRIVVYDESGDRLPMDPSLAGVGLSKSVIREASVSTLRGAENAAQLAFAHTAVAPGASLPFHAVLRALPLEAFRIGFEVIEGPARLAPKPSGDTAVAVAAPGMAAPPSPAGDMESVLEAEVEEAASALPERGRPGAIAAGNETPAAIAP